MNSNFIAIDFETATSNKMACQIGITIVENGAIKDTIVRLIQPPNNKYDVGCIQVHHITPEQTSKSPTFDIVWEEIKNLFINYDIVAHNASFDESVLYANLAHYNINHQDINPFICTYKLFGLSLEKLCCGFDIPLDNHHDAGFDSRCCAIFYLNHLNGIEFNRSKANSFLRDKQRSIIFHEALKGNILQKDLINANPCNPFYDKKVVITGIFDIERTELAHKLKSLGADIDTCITKKTNFVFIGTDAGPAKIQKIRSLIESGYIIYQLDAIDVDRLMQDDFSTIYHKIPEIMDDNRLFPLDDIQKNPFFGRRVAYTGDFLLDNRQLSKMLKEWGAEVNNTITKTTNFVLIGQNPNENKICQLDSRIHDGYQIQKLYQEDIDKIFRGKDWDKYTTKIENVKSLDFTLEHFNQHHYLFNEGVKNKIAGKELYFCKGFRQDKLAIEQITGNLAAWLNYTLSPQIQIFVLSNATIEKLKHGEKDESITMIQNYYNKNKGDKFDFNFMSEDDILNFAQLWSEVHDDKVMLALHKRYLQSSY